MFDALKLFSESFQPPLETCSVCIPQQSGCANAFAALSLALNANGANRIVLAVTAGIPDAEQLLDDLKTLTQNIDSAKETRILEFPPLLDGEKSALALRLKTASALKSWAYLPYAAVVVAPSSALSAPLPSESMPSVTVSVLDENASSPQPSFSELSERLAKIGYSRLAQVEQEGDFSVRGGIIDAWCPGEEFPVRIEFFGDELESIRAFDPATQISVKRILRAEFLPVEVNGDEGENASHLIDILPENAAILAIKHCEYSLPKAASREKAPFTVYIGEPPPQGVSVYSFHTSPLPGFAELGAGEAHHPELFESARRRLDKHISSARSRGLEILSLDALSGGFELDGKFIVVTKADRVFTKRKAHSRRSGSGIHGQRISDFDDLEPGELVVHLDYGVGRYIGSSEILVDGHRNEVYTIEYADGGKLHVPCSHAHLLSRYVGVKGESAPLHRLDGKRWDKDRKDAQKAVCDLAAALLETQAKRETAPGFKYDINCDGREAFDAAFPYEETPDQLSAIEAIDADLASEKPMDRLVCGDAGYGKTEVAMRAAYIAVMNGRQVAVLAPTTVLAEQHFETFTARFDGTPVRIESVSRFQTKGTHEGTFNRLETGVCDIVIGTHAILSSKIRFRDLGLIIIDEEQRFGVRQKEFLKRLRETADVLTLSATPIPRTLYLSMTGARDLSLLRSPPRERVAVETHIVLDNDETITSAIEREIARGGQVYFLHNRVMSIDKARKRLAALCPKARIVVAHGQMDAMTLAKKMRAFERGEFDILLSTTIIESGIDIPRANTILIDRAETFGMSDLYQLRGRVGRSSVQGMAYFLLPASGDIDSEARERLAALKRHQGLGSGFNLAVRDLELRGAGNLLGSQQSGHIAAVGFNLYCQLLKRTIARLKGERVKDVIDVHLNLDFAHPRIPVEYIEEDVLRMTLLKRFAEAQDLHTVKALADEMKDRFGPLPSAADEFVRIAALRVRCAMAQVSRVDAKGSRAVFYRNSSNVIAKVIDLKGSNARRKIAEIGSAADALKESDTP